MKLNKKIIGLGLATTFLLTTVVACTPDTSDVKNKNSDVEVIEEPTKEPETDKKDTDVKEGDTTAVPVEKSTKYVDYKGKVSEVLNVDNGTQAVVDGEGDTIEYKNIKFNISDDTVLVNDNTKDLITADKIKQGDTVEVFYDKDAPMTRSLPPMTNAKAIVLREASDEDKLAVKIAKFDENLVSDDNDLKLNLTDDTVIVDKSGKALNKEDMINKEVVAFYGPVETASIPGQSNADKIIVLSDGVSEGVADSADKGASTGFENDIKADDKLIVNEKEIILRDKMYKEDGRWMMPIRDVGVALGYDVKWVEETRIAELKKDAQMLTANADKDMYGIGEETIELGKAPDIKEARMYVPVSFIEKVMKLDVKVTEEGTIIVKL